MHYTGQDMLWLIGSLSRVFRIPFDPQLIRQQFPPPYSRTALLNALQGLDFKVGEMELDEEGIATLERTPFGFIHTGEPVKIKLVAYQFQKYGMVEGRVAHLSADASDTPPNQQPGKSGSSLPFAYRALIDLKAQHLIADGVRTASRRACKLPPKSTSAPEPSSNTSFRRCWERFRKRGGSDESNYQGELLFSDRGREMKKHNEEQVSLLRGLAGGDAFVDELLKQVDDFSNSVWESVAVETENYLTRANALDRFANAIERVTSAVLSDGYPVDVEKVEAARVQMSNLRAAAEKIRSAAIGIQSKAGIQEARYG